MPYRPIQTMNNSGWQTAREAAGLSGLHVHDLRHTFATRLRAMAVPEETIRVLLWHAKRSMTAHYSMAQVQELADAVERIIKESNTANLTLDMAIKEYRAQQARKSG